MITATRPANYLVCSVSSIGPIARIVEQQLFLQYLQYLSKIDSRTYQILKIGVVFAIACLGLRKLFH